MARRPAQNQGSAANLFQAVTVAPPKPSQNRPRFSLTSDIVSYRRCSRQYGYFGHDGFVPAEATQIFFGTIIHQVLDRCHRHYSGLLGHPFETVPAEADIEAYFLEVENALISHGVRPANKHVRDRALSLLKAFNRVEGPTLYPRVFDTEYRLESDRGAYICRGVVDVLANADSGSKAPDQVEIWDYKGSEMPDLSSQTLQDYEWQMCVYAELYKVRTGVYPARAILYFLNELHVPQGSPPLTARPLRAVRTVEFTLARIQQALSEFDMTANDIINCQANNAWPMPAVDPGQGTCDICDIRWNCQAVSGWKRNYPLRRLA